MHFNFYLAAGAGAAFVRFDSILQCSVDLPPNTSTCPGNNFRTRSTPTFAFNVGGGLRLFFTEGLSARVELRDVIYPDSYYTGFIPKTPRSNPGSLAPSPGVTFNPLIFFGLAWLIH